MKNAKINMFFTFKLMLIILLNKSYAYIIQDIQIILLPALNLKSTEKVPLTLKVFGKQIQLNLRKNDQIVSTFEIWKHDVTGITKELSELNASDTCYYFHRDHISTAAINFCQKHGWEGFIFLKNETLEIRPLRDDIASSCLIDDVCVKEEINISFGKPYLIKKSLQLSADSSFHNLDNFKLKRRHVRNTQEKLNIELAVFFDEAAYRTFTLFLGKDENILRMLILAYVNRIQALFHHPSLGVSIDISLVYLEIMDKQPSNLPVYGGDDEKLFYSFCNYTETRNPPNDNDPNHWDVGLYLTGINLYETLQGVILNSSLGISDRNSVCNLTESCVVVEFGIAGKISSGFSSSLIAAHEIGHVLGMKHDSDYIKPCDTNKYIMSSRISNQGQLTWSECSRNIAEGLWKTKKCLRDGSKNLENAYDHNTQYQNLPGRQWSAKAQCEIFFHDEDANVVSLLDVCKTIQCETLHDNLNFFTGPALEGTYCAPGKECRGGECVPVIEPPYIFKDCEEDKWSEWKESTCQSSCFKKSKGVRIRRRSCKHRSRRTASCKGPYYDVVLCNDTLLCTQKRKRINLFTTTKCTQLNSYAKLNNINLRIKLKIEPKWQAAHDVEKPWIACIIHCPEIEFSTGDVHLEMIRIGVDPYFPDGTWCHKKDGQNFYCRQHYCVPESYSCC
ncbi:A disintegrin and metalloproteinase with thrombospondin motifs adt-2-like [Linepithema humile]|uniref:A disintegrin and metalloproteinase with thrombospondin motifs adt-2-like n=1 Tax=Linepithema humile TaxID=83485 RepID=UPI00062364A9|nr:PREDICTED: A disintegrin and metalloproteinase with thrombospondin motifs 19-like [Linepithema humile]